MTVPSSQPEKYLTFILKDQLYGVPIGAVREINRISDITRVPRAPHYMKGLMNLRGKVIPVIDLRSRLGMPSTTYTKSTCIIVTEGEHGHVGMIVDAVSGVADFTPEQIEPNPKISGVDASDIKAMGKLEGQVVIFLDVLNCLSFDLEVRKYA